MPGSWQNINLAKIKGWHHTQTEDPFSEKSDKNPYAKAPERKVVPALRTYP